MCGRYTLTTPAELIAEVFEVEESAGLEPRYNIAPTQEAPIVRISRRSGGRALRPARWGLIPYWADDPAIGNRMINARAESAAEKPAFRDALRRRRCLVPADGFYEWQRRGRGPKQPYHVRLEDGSPFGFAGLWERWRRGPEDWVESFTILTTEASPRVAPIHDRMPLVLAPDHFAAWLDPQVDDPARLRPLLEPSAAPFLAVPVSTWVNDPAHDSPRCLEAVEADSAPHAPRLWENGG